MSKVELLVTEMNLLIKKLEFEKMKIYDDNDPDWYLDEVKINYVEDRLYFGTKEDRAHEDY